MEEILNLKDRVFKQTVRRDLLEKELMEKAENISRYTTLIVRNESALSFVKNISSRARENIAKHISDVVEMLLNSVYPEQHKFSMEFVERRNQVEVDYWLEYNGNKLQIKKPFVGVGGGKITIISLAMFLAVNNIVGNKYLILDEVTKMVDNQALGYLSEIMTTYCKKFHKTILTSSPREQLTENADNIFNVLKTGTVSKIIKVR